MIWCTVITRSWTWWPMSCSWESWSSGHKKHPWYPVGQTFSFFLLFTTASKCVIIIYSLSCRESHLWLSIHSYPFLGSPMKTEFRRSWVKKHHVYFLVWKTWSQLPKSIRYAKTFCIVHQKTQIHSLNTDCPLGWENAKTLGLNLKVFNHSIKKQNVWTKQKHSTSIRSSQ